MLRVSLRLGGPYLLNQRVVADWWQPRYRERMHEAAKKHLSAALQESAAAETQHNTSASDNGREGNSGDVNSDEVLAGSAVAAPPPPPLSLHDANALVATFVTNHNTEDLSATLQYIRERLGEELTPYHFHSLLRSFNFHHDLHNALQLLDVMVHSGTMTLETYARMMDCVHVLSPPDAQTRVLQLVALAEEAFGGQVMVEVPGSEGDTIALYGTGEAAAAGGGVSRGLAAASSDAADASPAPSLQTQSAPVLSSLLHHLSTTENNHTTVSCFLVALWIRALGIELSDWDVLAVLTTVVAHPEQFPRLCALFGHFTGFERGHVSVQAVLDRLVLLGEIDAEALTVDEGEGIRDGRKSGSGSNTHRGGAAPSPFVALVRAMHQSVRNAGGGAALTAVVPLSFINPQTSDLDALVWNTLRPLTRDGVGAHRYNAGHLLHALSLVKSSTGDDTGAVELLLRGLREQELQAAEQERLPTAEADMALAATSSLSAASNSGGNSGELFTVPMHHLADMGSLLTRLSTTTLRGVQRPFRASIRRLVNDLSERPTALDTEEDGGSGGMRASQIASCCSPIPSARDLMKLSSYETQFIRTVAEAREALRHAIDSSNAPGSNGRLPRNTQLLLYQLAEFCSRHPPRNPKLTPAGLEERAKWARYLDARDTSLALFGSARQSRDSMKHLFYHDNQMPALRSDAVIARDFADVYRIFFGPSLPQPSSTVQSQAELQQRLLRTRTTLPHTGSSEAAVPQYLWDPAVYNPYPAAQLPNNTAAGHSAFSAAEVLQLDPALGEAAEDVVEGGEEGGAGDAAAAFFVELWMALLDRTTPVGSNDAWYLQNTGMYLMLVRCLLHRLDWEAAVHLTRRMTQYAAYTHMMDHELTTIFREIGDPAGCLAFKVATKLFDGRITKDGHSKRESFQQEQFS